MRDAASDIRTLAFRQSRRPSRRSVVYCAGNEHRRRTKDGTATAQSSSSLLPLHSSKACRRANKRSPVSPSNQPPRRKQLTMALPIDAHADKIAEHVARHRVTVIHGETGCGKSSRVPLILLEADPDAKMFVSQPRRIAARALCDRVRDTHSDPDDIALRLGHGVRDEALDARIIFVTCGYLVRLVAHHPESLREHSHVIVDEVHERTVDADILCLLVRRLLDASPRLKVVLMSATLAGELYCSYFRSPPPIFVGAEKVPSGLFFR